MLTTPWVTALILLFALNPVAKLVRRFVYSLVEQYDRGDPVDDAQGGMKGFSREAQRGLHSLASAAFVAKEGFNSLRGLYGTTNSIRSGPGSGNSQGGLMQSANTSSPYRGLQDKSGNTGDNRSPYGSGEASQLQTSGHLPESRVNGLRGEGLNTFSRQNQQHNSLSSQGGNTHGLSNFNEADVDPNRELLRKELNLNPQAYQTNRVNDIVGGRRTTSQSTSSNRPARQPIIGQRSQQWGNIGRRALGTVGGIVSTGVGMGVAAFGGYSLGSAIARGGTQAFARTGDVLGRVSGTAFYAGRTFGQELKEARYSGQFVNNLSSSVSTAFKNTLETIRNERAQQREHIVPINTPEQMDEPSSFEYTPPYYNDTFHPINDTENGGE